MVKNDQELARIKEQIRLLQSEELETLREFNKLLTKMVKDRTIEVVIKNIDKLRKP